MNTSQGRMDAIEAEMAASIDSNQETLGRKGNACETFRQAVVLKILEGVCHFPSREGAAHSMRARDVEHQSLSEVLPHKRRREEWYTWTSWNFVRDLLSLKEGTVGTIGK